MAKRKRGIKWEMAAPIIRHDSLISSQQFKNLLPFEVSYESEKHVNISFLMGWEYGRMWFKEFKRWEAMNYGSKDEIKKKELFVRKTIVRPVKKRKPK